MNQSKLNKDAIKANMAQPFADRNEADWTEDERQMMNDANEGLQHLSEGDDLLQAADKINQDLMTTIRKKKQQSQTIERRKPMGIPNSILVVIVLLLVFIAFAVVKMMK